MNISELQNYDISFLPPMTWFAQGSADGITFLLGGFTAASLLYLLLSYATTYLAKDKRNKLMGMVHLVYMVLVFIISINVSGFSNSLPAAPLYIFVALFLVLIGIFILTIGAWPRIDPALKEEMRFSDFCSSNTWLNILMSGYILLPFVITNIPSFDHQKQIVYIGSPLLIIVLYLFVSRIIFANLALLLNLEVSPESLDREVQRRFEEASRPVRELADCKIVISRRGLLNAVAQPRLRRITVGLSLIDHLSEEQLQAVLTHEMGHLQDRVHLPKLGRFYQVGAFFYLFFSLLTASRLNNTLVLGIAAVLLALYFLIIATRNVRLHAEKVADSFVKEVDADLYPYLLSGLERIYELNGIDKDFCKKIDAGHLDIDERRDAVDTGKISKRSSSRSRMVRFLVVFLLSAGLTVGYAYFFPGPKRMWNRLHHQYHDQLEDNPAAAHEALESALALCKKGFPGSEEKTFKTLNDLANFYYTMDDLIQAEVYAKLAIDSGNQSSMVDQYDVDTALYLLADIYLDTGRFVQAERAYLALYEGNKRKYGVSLYDCGRLSFLYLQMENWEKAERYLRETIQIENNDSFTDTDELLSAYADLVYVLKKQSKFREADKFEVESHALQSKN